MEKPAVESIVKTAGNGTKRWYNMRGTNGEAVCSRQPATTAAKQRAAHVTPQPKPALPVSLPLCGRQARKGLPLWYNRMKKQTAAITAVVCVFLFATHTQALEVPARVTRTVTTTQKIPFATSYIDLPGIYRGYEEPVRSGTPGEQKIEAQVIYEGDRAVKVVSIKAEQTAQPVNAVVKRGTKVLYSETADGSAWKTSFARPLKCGWLSADFYDYPHHNGIDLAAPYGTPVYAAAEGVVEQAGWYGEYGICVILRHADGSRTLYGHNSSVSVSVGQTVKQGEKIANVGSTGNSTGNHLHFEIRVDGRMIDPLVYLDQ